MLRNIARLVGKEKDFYKYSIYGNTSTIDIDNACEFADEAYSTAIELTMVGSEITVYNNQRNRVEFHSFQGEIDINNFSGCFKDLRFVNGKNI